MLDSKIVYNALQKTIEIGNSSGSTVNRLSFSKNDSPKKTLSQKAFDYIAPINFN